MAREEARANGDLRIFVRLRRLAVDPKTPESIRDQLDEAAWETVREAEPVRLSYAQKLLEISNTAVRDWAHRGVLELFSDHGPDRVSLESVARAGELVAELRSLGRDRNLVSAVLNRLEDQELERDDRFQQSLEQMRRGQRGRWPGGE